MCAGTMYWANVGRLVYGAAEKRLLELTGSSDQNPTLDVPCRYVFEHSQKNGVLFARSRRTYGSPRLHRALRRVGHLCGRHRVARLMRRAGLAGRVRGRRRPWTTDSDHEQPIAPNRLGQRETPVERPNKVWAADITYVPTDEGWLYLAGVLDLGSRRLVGWAMGESLDTNLPMDALRMALRQRQPSAGLLHHSDRGCQSRSGDRSRNWKPSWSRRTLASGSKYLSIDAKLPHGYSQMEKNAAFT